MLVTDLKLGGYTFGVPTFYSSFHLGRDLSAKYITLSFPVDLFDVKTSNGSQGGLTVTGTDRLGYIHRFMHLSKTINVKNTIAAYVDFAISGNTGSYTTSPHLHHDIRKPGQTTISFKNFIDPEYWKNNILPKIMEKELSDWQKEFVDWATKAGVSNGERPLDSITRVEAMGMMKKFENHLVGAYNLKKIDLK